MNRPILKYIGRQYYTETAFVRLWNLYNSPNPDIHPDGSSISLLALKNLGIV